MNLDKMPLMNAIAKKLSWLSQKQEVISQNVANANTPGYRAKKIRELEFDNMVKSSAGSAVKTAAEQGLRKTNPKHISAPSSSGKTAAKIDVDDHASDSSVNGNTVVLEEQMMEMAKTQIEYSTMVNLYRRQKGLLKMALGKPSR